jgi:peptidoglycan/xylan/chitin deacetylase (PgdA/CDA1 family)
MIITLLLAFISIFAAFQVSAGVTTQCVQSGMFAMTFDDGPSDNISGLLSILDSRKIKVTFHFTTQYLTDPNVQATVKKVVSAGHLIGLRSENTWNLLNMSSDDITASVQRVANVMAQFAGYKPTFIRLPYGQYDDRVLAAVSAAGMIVTQQNLDSYDYNVTDPDKVYSNFQLALALQADAAGNYISVQHDAVKASVDATGKIIDLVLSKKYNMVRLDACVGKVPPTANTGVAGSGGNSGGNKGTGGGSNQPGGNNSGSSTNSATSNVPVALAFSQVLVGLLLSTVFVF